MSLPDSNHNGHRSITLDLQWECDCSDWKINDSEVLAWVSACADEIGITDFELAVRVIDSREMVDLNSKYGGREYGTNVLAFENDEIDESGVRLLGDIVICAPVLLQESLQQGKEKAAHFAHMLIHGILHLAGYDHLYDKEAEEMEIIEIKILSTLGWTNPYIEKRHND